MADKKPTTYSAEIVAAPFGMPRVAMPQEVSVSEYGMVTFLLTTPAGPVDVLAFRDSFDCRGTVAALIAAGFAQAGWFPGLPGNQKTCQKVVFDSSGPKLLVGKLQGKRQTQPHIVVSRRTNRAFTVKIPATPEQHTRLEMLRDQSASRAKTARDMGERKNSERFWDDYDKQEQERCRNRSVGGLREDALYCLGIYEQLLGVRLSGDGVRYADEVIAEVHTHMNAIRCAFLGGKVLPAVSQYRRDGNVVYFPVAAPQG